MCEIYYHKTVRDTKQNFKENKMISVCCVARRGGDKRTILKKNRRYRYAAKEIRFAPSLWRLTEHLSYRYSFLNLLDFA